MVKVEKRKTEWKDETIPNKRSNLLIDSVQYPVYGTNRDEMTDASHSHKTQELCISNKSFMHVFSFDKEQI